MRVVDQAKPTPLPAGGRLGTYHLAGAGASPDAPSFLAWLPLRDPGIRQPPGKRSGPGSNDLRARRRCTILVSDPADDRARRRVADRPPQPPSRRAPRPEQPLPILRLRPPRHPRPLPGVRHRRHRRRGMISVTRVLVRKLMPIAPRRAAVPASWSLLRRGLMGIGVL